MAENPEHFAQAFSDLTNALQTAIALAAERATVARSEAAETDRLYAAITRAAEAARQLRPTGDNGR